MRIYGYYTIPGRTAPEDAVALAEGFCWGALAFGFVWALWRGLWLEAAALAAAPALIARATEALGASPAAAAGLVALVALFAACNGNDWRRARLERRGFALVGLVAARSPAEADRRFFDTAARSVPPPLP